MPHDRDTGAGAVRRAWLTLVFASPKDPVCKHDHTESYRHHHHRRNSCAAPLITIIHHQTPPLNTAHLEVRRGSDDSQEAHQRVVRRQELAEVGCLWGLEEAQKAREVREMREALAAMRR